MQLEHLKSVLANGNEHLGDVLFWTLADARIDRATLESIWTSSSLDPALLPDAPTAERALKLAVREAQVGQQGRLIRLGKEDERAVIFGIVREERHHPDGSLTYTQEARVHLDRQHDALTTDVPGHDIVATITAGFHTFKNTHPADDVRRAIVKALHTFAAVALRDGGGVYWVPAPYAGKLRDLQTCVEKIGSSRIFILPIHKSAESERTLGEIAKGSIEGELAALQAEIAQFVAVPPDRASTLVRRFDAFSALKSRAQLYKTVLSIEVQDLDRQLAQLTSAVEQMLDQKSAA